MKVLILSNLISYTYNFRLEIIDAILKRGARVVVVADNDSSDKAALLNRMGCELINVPFDVKGTDIGNELKLIRKYNVIIRNEKPDIVLTFTIKPNLYGGLISRYRRISYIPMITGLGEVEKEGKLQKPLLFLHRIVMPKAQTVIFQNKDNFKFFKNKRIKVKKAKLVPGSGINLIEYKMMDYPSDGEEVHFGYLGRLTKAKGIEDFLGAAEILYDKGLKVKFHVAGKMDEEYVNTIKKLTDKGIVDYQGVLENTKDFYKMIHCLVLPTYHPEGISNVLLEASASGRPAICTNRTGCKEVIKEGFNGMYCNAKDSYNLAGVMNAFYSLNYDRKKEMGMNGRKLVEKRFSREKVVSTYMDEIFGN